MSIFKGIKTSAITFDPEKKEKKEDEIVTEDKKEDIAIKEKEIIEEKEDEIVVEDKEDEIVTEDKKTLEQQAQELKENNKPLYDFIISLETERIKEIEEKISALGINSINLKASKFNASISSAIFNNKLLDEIIKVQKQTKTAKEKTKIAGYQPSASCFAFDNTTKIKTSTEINFLENIKNYNKEG